MNRLSHRLLIEVLEDRNLLSTCNVSRLADTGNGFGLRGDLRYCLNLANNLPGEDLIIFRPTAHGTIQLSGALPNVSDDLIIAGPGADVVTVRRETGGDYRIFTVAEGVTAQIYSVTMENGRMSAQGPKSTWGGGILNTGTLTLGGVIVQDSHVVDFQSIGKRGGAISNEGDLVIYDSTITGNSTTATQVSDITPEQVLGRRHLQSRGG